MMHIVDYSFTVKTVYFSFLVQEKIPQVQIQRDVLSWVIKVFLVKLVQDL
jgi:hypothetical protein